ncbi:YugN family protein [Sporosarcina gallistercoris]|uniref:YugN family protein n=1 Tax=Sporosarcina gallistercoris TaxID=2762245 RepID=UPI003D2D6247
MIALKSKIEGKTVIFGNALKLFKEAGLDLGGGWEYDHGMFDTILYQREETTIYLRVPFQVVKGELDSSNTVIRFQTPFVIKHVMNIGLDEEDSPAMTVTGLEQFQAPQDPDAPIDRQREFAIDAQTKLDQITEDVMFAST